MNKDHYLMQTDAINVPAKEARVAFIHWTATQGATADADGIIDGGACSATESVTIPADEGHETLPCARNVTATPGGTAANIKAVRVKVYGADIDGRALMEELPAFTADSATAVTGSLAFSRVDKIVVPAMDGEGVTVDLGYGNKYGLPYMFTSAPLALASVDNVSKTASFGNTSGKFSTVTFSTNPAGKCADLVLFY